MGVPLANARVGAFRTSHALRCYTSFRTGLTPLLHAPHATTQHPR
ncbi:MAG: hypothetical protein NZ455_07650 [Bacteroidia bacterium]|nr:hypothetical protein [Bacteroidia bacterium]MDW8346672.1 hypothetical protein [Bacteroidia bacterium]